MLRRHRFQHDLPDFMRWSSKQAHPLYMQRWASIPGLMVGTDSGRVTPNTQPSFGNVHSRVSVGYSEIRCLRGIVGFLSEALFSEGRIMRGRLPLAVLFAMRLLLSLPGGTGKSTYSCWGHHLD